MSIVEWAINVGSGGISYDQEHWFLILNDGQTIWTTLALAPNTNLLMSRRSDKRSNLARTSLFYTTFILVADKNTSGNGSTPHIYIYSHTTCWQNSRDSNPLVTGQSLWPLRQCGAAVSTKGPWRYFPLLLYINITKLYYRQWGN